MNKRTGFTLIEMMVATALTLFLMVIMTEAFVAALDTFTGLKAIGDMEEGLRTATVNLRSDLSQDHFDGSRRLSDTTLSSTNPPTQGFFVVYQGGASYAEGTGDNDLGIASNVSPDPTKAPPLSTGHILHFSVRRRGNGPHSVFYAPVPYPDAKGNYSPLISIIPPSPGQLNSNFVPTNFFNQPMDSLWQPTLSGIYTSPWAEVAYFLWPTGSTTNPHDQPGTTSYVKGSNTQLYGLFRSEFVVVPRNDLINAANVGVGSFASGQYLNMACTDQINGNGSLYFFSPSDLAQNVSPSLRTFVPGNENSFPKPPQQYPVYKRGSLLTTNSSQLSYLGATQVLNNVVSFNVRVLTTPGGSTADFADLGTTGFPLIYDTANLPTAGTPQIYGLQISIRVWDQRTQQSRQITIVQDM